MQNSSFYHITQTKILQKQRSIILQKLCTVLKMGTVAVNTEMSLPFLNNPFNIGFEKRALIFSFPFVCLKDTPTIEEICRPHSDFSKSVQTNAGNWINIH